MSSTTDGAAGKPARRPGRRLLRVALLFLFLIAGAVGYVAYRYRANEQVLQEVLAETDRLDPGWRLAELEEVRPELPFEENSAKVIAKLGNAAIPILNKGKTRENLITIGEEINKLPPRVRLDARQTAQLQQALAPVAELIKEARQLETLPRGRHWCNVNPAASEAVPHIDQAGLTTWILSQDAMLRLQGRDVATAFRACMAIHNVSRSFMGEPLGIAQAIRVQQRQMALQLLERCLAQGEIPEKDLALLQARLDEEAGENLLLLALRSHRARVHHFFKSIDSGISLAEWQQAVGSGRPGWHGRVQSYFLRASVKPAHAWALRYYNQAVEIAKRPPAEAEAALDELKANIADVPELAEPGTQLAYLQGLMPQSEAAQRDVARIALAVERYRLREGRWPATLQDVVAADLLEQTPSDPYDGKPLRYRPTKDGVVIYSIGPDGRGDGATLDRRPIPEDRFEFRLWDRKLR